MTTEEHLDLWEQELKLLDEYERQARSEHRWKVAGWAALLAGVVIDVVLVSWALSVH